MLWITKDESGIIKLWILPPVKTFLGWKHENYDAELCNLGRLEGDFGNIKFSHDKPTLIDGILTNNRGLLNFSSAKVKKIKPVDKICETCAYGKTGLSHFPCGKNPLREVRCYSMLDCWRDKRFDKNCFECICFHFSLRKHPEEGGTCMLDDELMSDCLANDYKRKKIRR